MTLATLAHCSGIDDQEYFDEHAVGVDVDVDVNDKYRQKKLYLLQFERRSLPQQLLQRRRLLHDLSFEPRKTEAKLDLQD